MSASLHQSLTTHSYARLREADSAARTFAERGCKPSTAAVWACGSPCSTSGRNGNTKL